MINQEIQTLTLPYFRSLLDRLCPSLNCTKLEKNVEEISNLFHFDVKYSKVNVDFLEKAPFEKELLNLNGSINK